VLILLRHGQTATNAAGRLLGRADPSLTDLGRRQAEAAAVAIGPVSRVITSPLARARETAAYIDAPCEVDQRWIEIDYGEFENLPLGDVPADFWARWRADPSLAPPGGESLAAVGERVREACEALAAEAAAADVVVVSHVSPIKAAVVWALGGTHAMQFRMFLDVAAVSRIGIREQGPVLVSFDERIPLD
jgi:broad specificity phosphatase PhoE